MSSSTTRELLEVALYGQWLLITLTHPVQAPPLEAAAVERPCSSRLKINLLTAPCLLSVLLEQWNMDVAEGLARPIDDHGRYEKRRRQNLWQKFFSLACRV